jgi:hypothetical protein
VVLIDGAPRLGDAFCTLTPQTRSGNGQNPKSARSGVSARLKMTDL